MADFAEALTRAVDDSGLSLERVQHHLGLVQAIEDGVDRFLAVQRADATDHGVGSIVERRAQPRVSD